MAGPCGDLPNRAEYLATGGKGNDAWLKDYEVYLNCLNEQTLPSHVCPPGYTWYGADAPYGGCLPTAYTQEQAVKNQGIFNSGDYSSQPVTSDVPSTTAGPVTATTAGPVKTAPAPAVLTHTPQNAALGFKAHYNGSGEAGVYCDLFPNDPYCNFWDDLGFYGGIIGGGGGSVTNQTIIQQSGLLASDVHQIVNEALNGLWGAVVGVVDLALGGALAGVQAAVTGLGNALKAAWNILSRLGGLILQFLSTLWNKIIAGLLRALHDLANALKDLYTKALRPMLESLQRIRKQILDYYVKFVRPTIIAIQKVRQVLAVLKLFHVKWAATLDAKLADLEQRITAPLFTLLHMVNTLANFFNLILTAGGLIQRPILLGSIGHNIGPVVNLTLNSMTKPADPAKLAALQAKARYDTAGQSQASLSAFLSRDSSKLDPVITQQHALLDAILTRSA